MGCKCPNIHILMSSSDFCPENPFKLEDEAAGSGEVETKLQQICQTTGKVCPSVLLEKGDVILLQDLPYSYKQQVIVMQNYPGGEVDPLHKFQ